MTILKETISMTILKATTTKTTSNIKLIMLRKPSITKWTRRVDQRQITIMKNKVMTKWVIACMKSRRKRMKRKENMVLNMMNTLPPIIQEVRMKRRYS